MPLRGLSLVCSVHNNAVKCDRFSGVYDTRLVPFKCGIDFYKDSLIVDIQARIIRRFTYTHHLFLFVLVEGNHPKDRGGAVKTAFRFGIHFGPVASNPG